MIYDVGVKEGLIYMLAKSFRDCERKAYDAANAGLDGLKNPGLTHH